MTEVSVYVEITKQSRQYESAKIGIRATQDFDPKEGETPKDTIKRGSRALYNVVSDQVGDIMAEALTDLRS